MGKAFVTLLVSFFSSEHGHLCISVVAAPPFGPPKTWPRFVGVSAVQILEIAGHGKTLYPNLDLGHSRRTIQHTGTILACAAHHAQALRSRSARFGWAPAGISSYGARHYQWVKQWVQHPNLGMLKLPAGPVQLWDSVFDHHVIIVNVRSNFLWSCDDYHCGSRIWWSITIVTEKSFFMILIISCMFDGCVRILTM